MALNSVFDFPQTAASVTDYGGTSVLGTGLVSTADDSFRNLAAMLAKWRDDIGGTATTASANTVTVTLNQTFTAYTTGQMFRVKFGATNTSQTVTLNVNGLGAKNVKIVNALGTQVNPPIGALAIGAYGNFLYDGTSLLLLNPGGAATIRQRTNRFWNPSMDVSQQNGTTLGTTNGYFGSDSLAAYFVSTAGAISFQQVSVTSLNGSTKQVQWKCTTANASPAASNFDSITGKIEGLNAADLRWGTASANQATLSFQFTGPAGTYNVHIQNRSANRHIAIPFTPTAANTEERITVVIPGDTSGTWTVDNDTLVTIDFMMLVGSTFVGGSASTWSASTFYAAATQFNGRSVNTNTVNITDVQFTVDPDATGVAPAWEPVNIGQMTKDSQRYYLKQTSVFIAAPGVVASAGAFAWIAFPTTMRAAPSGTFSNPSYTAASGGSLGAQTVDGVLAQYTVTGTNSSMSFTHAESARMT